MKKACVRCMRHNIMHTLHKFGGLYRDHLLVIYWEFFLEIGEILLQIEL